MKIQEHVSYQYMCLPCYSKCPNHVPSRKKDTPQSYKDGRLAIDKWYIYIGFFLSLNELRR